MPDAPIDHRSNYQRDIDKFYYSKHFRRLAGVTQVVNNSTSTLVHNRMTHSLKVAQVGHRLAQYIILDPRNGPGIEQNAGLEPDCVFAAGLAHDIGHPPFGHNGEQALDEYLRSCGVADGFEGNAQSFRLITRMTKRISRHVPGIQSGMGLQSRTVAAVVKYPWPRSKRRGTKKFEKFGYYLDDGVRFDTIVSPHLRHGRRTLEASLMDWADDITYALHDVEDFFLAGRIPLNVLRAETSSSYVSGATPELHRFLNYAVPRLEQKGIKGEPAVREFLDFSAKFPRTPFTGTELERAWIGRTVSDALSSITDTSRVRPDGSLDRGRSGRNNALVAIMKELTWFFVIDRPVLAEEQRGQRRRLSSLLLAYDEWIAEITRSHTRAIARGAATSLSGFTSLPAGLIECLRDVGYFRSLSRKTATMNRFAMARAVADYVSSMSEPEVALAAKRLTTGG